MGHNLLKSYFNFIIILKTTMTTFSIDLRPQVHLAHGHADAKDGIGAQLVLVVSPIQGQLKKQSCSR